MAKIIERHSTQQHHYAILRKPPHLKREEVKYMTLEDFLLSVLASLLATAIAELVRKWLGER